MSNITTIGKIITDTNAARDAIHTPIAPVIARQWLMPGTHVMLVDGQAEPGPREKCIGVVDPFLPAPVAPGQRFWLFVYLNTITDLRHDWGHPAFVEQPKPVEDDEDDDPDGCKAMGCR